MRRRRATIVLVLWGVGTAGLGPPLRADPLPDSGVLPKGAPKPLPLRSEDMVWDFGISMTRSLLRSESGQDILGNYGAVAFGAGYITTSWFALGSLEFLTGPFEPAAVGQLGVNYSGMGATAWSGLSLPLGSLRRQGQSYGIALGVTYSDLIGRSIGRNGIGPMGQDPALSIAPIDPSLIESYTVSATNLSVVPGLFWAWNEAPRARGNSPELLATRVEGILANLGIARPMGAEFTKKMRLINGTEAADRGRLTGLSFVLSIHAMIAP